MKQTTTTRIDLHEATHLELLLHALALDGEEDGQGVRIVESVRQEVDVLAELAVRSQAGVEVELGDFGAALEGMGRRLAVGLELMRRERRPAAKTEEAEA